MKNQFLIMEKLKDSLKGLDEATKNAEADRAALIMRIDELESALVLLTSRVENLDSALSELDVIQIDTYNSVQKLNQRLIPIEKVVDNFVEDCLPF